MVGGRTVRLLGEDSAVIVDINRDSSPTDFLLSIVSDISFVLYYSFSSLDHIRIATDARPDSFAVTPTPIFRQRTCVAAMCGGMGGGG